MPSTSTPSLIQIKWRLKSFLALQFISFALLLSWLFPQQAALWNWLDIPIYRTLNNTLGHWPAWDVLWALLSTRIADLLAAVCMLWLLIKGDSVFKPSQLRSAFIGFFALLVVLLIVRTLLDKFLEYTDLEHASPTYLLTGGFKLTDCYPSFGPMLKVKDAASNSFPGDHASVLLLWMTFLSFFARGKKLLLVWAIGLFFMIPRLIAGAHWFTDNLIGGGFVVMQTLAWSYCTALGKPLHKAMQRITLPGFWLLERIPILNRLAIARTYNEPDAL